jgi:hypothetical protein
VGNYFGISPDYITYGGVEKVKRSGAGNKNKNTIAWIGRLDKSTDLPGFLEWFKQNNKKYSVTFVGDGELKNECIKLGKVTGFVSDTTKYMFENEYVVPVGYLSYLEAKSVGAKIMTFPVTPIKKDYWRGIGKISKIPSWTDVTKIYLNLWKIN